MRVLVTGARGQLGGALQRTTPYGVDLLAVDVDECDLTDAGAMRALVAQQGPDVIVNTAAYTAVDAAETDEVRAQAINADAVAAMVGALKDTGGKLVQISTDFVFDGESARAYRPGDDRNPLSVYGRTKAAGEDCLRDTDLLVRTSWLYDAGGANFVRTMIRLMNERDEVGVVADQIGAPTWATALAKIIWKLIDVDASGTYHYSDAGVASWYDFAVAIAEEARAMRLIERSPIVLPISTADYPTPAKRPRFSLLDSGETHAKLGSVPTHWRTNLWHMLRTEKDRG